MKKLWYVCLALAVAAPGVLAGGPPVRRDGERRPPFVPGAGPQGRPFEGLRDQFRGGEFFGSRSVGNAFDALRRYFDITPEQQAAITKLEDQKLADEREALAALGRTLDKKYAALILEVLPADQKAKYEGVLAALAAREEALEAAQKEYRAVLTKVRADQRVAGRALGANLPNSKGELIRQCLNLSEAQRGAIDGVQRDAWGNMRDKMRDVPRPEDWRDAAARQKYAEGIRKVREQVDGQAAEAMALLLNEEQKKAYQAMATALEAYNKKVAEADEACEKKLIELVGPEKARAMRAAWWQLGPGGQPGGPQPRGGEAQPQPKATEF